MYCKIFPGCNGHMTLLFALLISSRETPQRSKQNVVQVAVLLLFDHVSIAKANDWENEPIQVGLIRFSFREIWVWN